MSTETTPRYGFRYPDTTEQPNGPLQLEELAEDVEGALGPIEDSIFTPLIIVGDHGISGSTGDVSITTGFQPQFVQFITYYSTDPNENAKTATSHGWAGLDTSGDITMILETTGSSSGNFSRHIVLDHCVGALTDGGGSTTLIGSAYMKSFDPTGFTLHFDVASGNNYNYSWAAYQGVAS